MNTSHKYLLLSSGGASKHTPPSVSYRAPTNVEIRVNKPDCCAGPLGTGQLTVAHVNQLINNKRIQLEMNTEINYTDAAESVLNQK